MTRDGETVTPLLPEPGVWTGMAEANVWAPLRWKHAKIHRGSRRRILRPHQEAGYTSAVVTVAPNPVSLLQSGGVHIRPHMTQSGASSEFFKRLNFWNCPRPSFGLVAPSRIVDPSRTKLARKHCRRVVPGRGSTSQSWRRTHEEGSHSYGVALHCAAIHF